MRKNGRKKSPRMKWGIFCALAVFIAFLIYIFFSWPKTRVLGLSTKLSGTEIIQLINLERAKKGLAAVTINEKLSQAAVEKGKSMLTQNYWAHVAPDGTEPWQFISESGYAYQSAGENLARDFNNEKSLLNGWLNSPTHKANILNGNFSETGVAVLDGEINGEPVLLVVNLFAQPRIHDDLLPQVAIYQNSSDSLVLAGEIIPQGQLMAKKSMTFSLKQILFAFAVVALVSYLLYNLTLVPRGRKRKL